MTWTYAGEWTGDILYQSKGTVSNVPVAITKPDTTAATLYTDASKGTALGSNSVNTDAYGNLAFFADPGTYTCTVPTGGSFPAVVAISPLEFVADIGDGGGVTSVNTQTGVVVLTAAEVGADASGAASTAQSNAETFATAAVTAAVATETSRAEAAEATLTTSASTNATAIGAETSRAETAEGLKAPLASPTFTGTPAAPTAVALTSTTQLATTAYTDNAVGVEASRAQTAEALALPKAGGTMSGVIAMGAHKITGGAAATAGTDIPIYSQTTAGGTIVSGQYLCAPTSYAPGTYTQFTMNTTTLTAVSSTNISTGSFTAPVSGNVIVTVSFLGANGATAQNYAIGLLNHGLSTVAGNAVVNRYAANAAGALATVPFLVTGLSGTCNFDLAIATAGVGALTVNCQAISATTPSLANQAAPVLMTVQAV